MQIQLQSFFLRSHLLKMAMLSQKAVDLSIKAHELGLSEIYAAFWKNDQEWRTLQRRIGERGRRLCASGTPIDYDSKVAYCALRIYSALHVTYTASCEIVQVGARIIACERTNSHPCLQTAQGSSPAWCGYGPLLCSISKHNTPNRFSITFKARSGLN